MIYCRDKFLKYRFDQVKFRSKAETLEDLNLSFREKINIPEFFILYKKTIN